MSTVISMLIGSKFSTKELVTNSVLSIIKNMGCEDYHLVIGVAPYIRQEIKRKLIGIRNRKKIRKNITIEEKNCHTFATFTNYVFYSAYIFQ